MMSTRPRPNEESKIECVCGSKECLGVSSVFKVLKDKRGCFVELPPTEIERTLMMLDGDPAVATGQASQLAWQLRHAYLRHLNVDEGALEDNVNYYVALHHFHPKVVQDSHTCESDARLAIVCRTIHETSWKSIYMQLKDEDRIPGTDGSYFVVPNYAFVKAKQDAQKAFHRFRSDQGEGSVSGFSDAIRTVQDSEAVVTASTNRRSRSRTRRSGAASVYSMPVAVTSSPYTNETVPLSMASSERHSNNKSSSVQHGSSKAREASSAAVPDEIPTRIRVSMPWTKLIYQPKDEPTRTEARSRSSARIGAGGRFRSLSRGRGPERNTNRAVEGPPSTALNRSNSDKNLLSGNSHGLFRRARSQSRERGIGLFRGRSRSITRNSESHGASTTTSATPVVSHSLTPEPKRRPSFLASMGVVTPQKVQESSPVPKEGDEKLQPNAPTSDVKDNATPEKVVESSSEAKVDESTTGKTSEETQPGKSFEPEKLGRNPSSDSFELDLDAALAGKTRVDLDDFIPFIRPSARSTQEGGDIGRGSSDAASEIAGCNEVGGVDDSLEDDTNRSCDAGAPPQELESNAEPIQSDDHHQAIAASQVAETIQPEVVETAITTATVIASSEEEEPVSKDVDEEKSFFETIIADDDRSGCTVAATESVASVQADEESVNHKEIMSTANPFGDVADEPTKPLDEAVHGTYSSTLSSNPFDAEVEVASTPREMNPFDQVALSQPVSSVPCDEKSSFNPFDDAESYSVAAKTPSPTKSKAWNSSPSSEESLTETTFDMDSSLHSLSPAHDNAASVNTEDQASAYKIGNNNGLINFQGTARMILPDDDDSLCIPEELNRIKQLSEKCTDRLEAISILAAIETKRKNWATNELRGFKEQWSCYKDLIPAMARETEWVEDLLKNSFKTMEGYSGMVRAITSDSLLDETDRIIADPRKRVKLAAKRSRETSKFPSESSIMQPVLDMLLNAANQLDESIPSLRAEVGTLGELSAKVTATGSDLAKTGDRIMQDMECMESKIQAAWAHLEIVDNDLEGTEDRWLAEASYRNTVREASAVFKKNYVELMKVCDGILAMDEDRRNRTKEVLLSFLPRKRRLFLRVLESFQPAVTSLENGRLGLDEISAGLDQAIEHMTRQSLAKQHRSRSGILNRSLTNKLDLNVELDLTAVAENNLFDSLHVKELRAIEAKGGTKEPWQLSLAVLTHDGYLHVVYCDLPESQLQEFQESQDQAEVFLASKCHGRMPDLSLPLFDCRSSLSANKEWIEIVTDGGSPLQKMLKRKVCIRLSNAVDTARWFEAHDAFWSRQGEETSPHISRV